MALMQNYGLTMGDYGMGIQNLRKKQLFDNYGMGDLYQQSQQSPFSQSIPEEEDIETQGMPQESAFDIPSLRSHMTIGKMEVPKSPSFNLPAPTDPRPDDYISELTRLRDVFYKPETQATERYNRLLDEIPQKEEPGWLRRIVASGIGLGSKEQGGGVEGMERVMYAPYLRDMAEWKAKADPFAKGAELENTSNNIGRQMAGTMATNLTNQRRSDQTAQTAADKIASQERIASEKADIARTIARAQALKAQQWDIQIIGDRVVGFDPKNPGKPVDLGSSGKMDEYERLVLLSKQRMQESMVDTAGDIALKQTPGAPGTRGSGTGTGGSISPKDLFDNEQNTIKYIWSQGTDLNRFIVQDGTIFQIKPPRQEDYYFKSSFDKDFKDYTTLLAQIKGIPMEVNPGGGMTTPPATRVPATRVPPTGATPNPSGIPTIGSGNQSTIPGRTAPPQASAAPAPAQSGGSPLYNFFTGNWAGKPAYDRSLRPGETPEQQAARIRAAVIAGENVQGPAEGPGNPSGAEVAIYGQRQQQIQKEIAFQTAKGPLNPPVPIPSGMVALFDPQGNYKGYILDNPQEILQAAQNFLFTRR